MRKILVLAWATAAAATAFSAVIQGTVFTEGDQKTGAVKWNHRAKSYTITQKQGNASIDVEVPAADVTDLNIAKPANIDAAIAQVQKGQGAAAIGILQGIVKEYSHLQWDKIAGRYLVEAYLAANRGEDALKSAQAIIASDPGAAFVGELAPAYWQALLKLNQKPKLEAALAKAAASGDRFSSGAAFTLRGDIIMQEGGESADAAKKALADGYLRVVLMYTDQPVAAKLRPEALYKAAQCFEKLGQSGRAEAMRGELKKLYPNTLWAMK